MSVFYRIVALSEIQDSGVERGETHLQFPRVFGHCLYAEVLTLGYMKAQQRSDEAR